MISSVIKSFSFESAHMLPNVPEGHKCGRMHGHSFKAEIEISGNVDPHSGFVVDFAEISEIWQPLREQLDHRLLNEITGLENPTSEMICKWIWEKLKPKMPGLASVILHETCTAKCVYRGD